MVHTASPVPKRNWKQHEATDLALFRPVLVEDFDDSYEKWDDEWLLVRSARHEPRARRLSIG